MFTQQDEDGTHVYLDNNELTNYEYKNRNLSWSSDKGNKSNGTITFKMSSLNTNTLEPVFFGSYWLAGQSKPTKANFTGKMDLQYLAAWNGYYRTYNLGNKSEPYGLEFHVQGGNDIGSSHVFYGGKEAKIESYQNPNLILTLPDGTKLNVTFYHNPKANDQKNFTGFSSSSSEKKPTIVGIHDDAGLKPWSAYYKTNVKAGDKGDWPPGPEIIVEGAAADNPEDNKVTINGHAVKGLQFNNPVLSWEDSSNEYNASITFYVPQGKAKASVRKFAGKIWKPTESKPSKDNFSGVVDDSYLLSWTGKYYTLEKKNGTWAQGPVLEVNGKQKKEDSTMYLNGKKVGSF